MAYANNKVADQPLHPRSLISTFVVRFLVSIIHVLAISEISRLKLASIAEQAGLSLTWSKILKTFSPDEARIIQSDCTAYSVGAEQADCTCYAAAIGFAGNSF